MNDRITFRIGPNPANSKATIYYHLKNKTRLRLYVLNPVIENVCTLDLGTPAQGDGQFDLDCSKFAPGVYVVVLVPQIEGSVVPRSIHRLVVIH
jgi:hypothetical protein